MVSSDPMQVSVALNPGQKACTGDQKVWFIISLLAGDVHQNIDQLEIFLRILAICQLQIQKNGSSWEMEAVELMAYPWFIRVLCLQ